MIKANELRIDNWVQDSKGNTIKVHNIIDFGINAGAADHGSGSYFDVEFKFENISGIPLSEDWRLRLGFINSQLTIGHLSFVYFGDDNIGIKGMLGMVKPMNCKFVHHIQNIVLDLTGEELEIKEKV